MDWIRKFPVENIILDAVLLAVAFLLPSTNLFLAQHLTVAFWIAAPIQVLALFCAFYGRSNHSSGRNLPNWLSSFYVLNLILAVGSFLWLFFVAFAVEKQTGEFPHWGFRFAFFAALFGGILAFGVSSEMGDGERSISTRAKLVLAVFFYLCFTESLLEVSVDISNPGMFTVILVTFISYLPVRLALAFQPPFSYWDLTSAIVCFALYLYSLAQA